MNCEISDRGCPIMQDLKIDVEKMKTIEEICKTEMAVFKKDAWLEIGEIRKTVNSLAIKIALMTGALNLIGLIIIKYVS
jgi:hypothetical protein